MTLSIIRTHGPGRSNLRHLKKRSSRRRKKEDAVNERPAQKLLDVPQISRTPGAFPPKEDAAQTEDDAHTHGGLSECGKPSLLITMVVPAFLQSELFIHRHLYLQAMSHLIVYHHFPCTCPIREKAEPTISVRPTGLERKLCARGQNSHLGIVHGFARIVLGGYHKPASFHRSLCPMRKSRPRQYTDRCRQKNTKQPSLHIETSKTQRSMTYGTNTCRIHSCLRKGLHGLP